MEQIDPNTGIPRCDRIVGNHAVGSGACITDAEGTKGNTILRVGDGIIRHLGVHTVA